MMTFTFKQLEAVYWVAQLGGFAQAAHKLSTSQSAISKRIQELEAAFSTELFDRSLRTAKLTEKGEEMLVIARRLLEQRDQSVDQFAKGEVTERRIRIGVTELTAMTWLPQLVAEVQARYPKVVFEPDVNDSFRLIEKVLSDRLDLIILPDLFEDSKIAKTPIGQVRNAWMCKPGLVKKKRVYTVHDIVEHRLLTQGNLSATGRMYDRWFDSVGAAPAERIVTNNLMAIMGMTASGLGVSHLPEGCMQPMIAAGMLQVMPVEPAVPDVPFVCAHRVEKRSTLVKEVIKISRERCDFSRPFQVTQ